MIRWAESRDIPVSHLEVLHHVLEAKDLYFDPKNGLLMHKKGMMDAGSYYPVQTVWPDLYLECSSCGTYWFVGRLHRAEAVRHQLGLPDTEVRIPDREIPALEAYVVGPGRYADRSDLDRERGAKTSALAKDIQRLKQEAEKKITSGASDEEREARDRARIELEKAKAELEEKKISFHRDTIRAVIEGVDMTEEEGSIYRQYDLVIPKEIHAYWASLLANTGDALERAREQVNNLPLKAVVYTEQVRNGIPPTSI